MTRKFVNALGIATIAASLGVSTLASPAMAGGSIRFYLSPQTAQDAEAMDFGLRAYSLYNGWRNGAHIRQLGRNNLAGIGQNGRDNLGIVRQEGVGHSATLQQSGNDNSYGIFQFGRNTDTQVVQRGDGQSGAALLFGW
ncbi:curlin [Rhizobium jaguaris]|uniref:Curlin n=1 Tax=Rhizobium jaguaris TaxID=1312183 RepID=A0A387G6T6_9HYPH|nr:curlin [Rhizobium jaguaris]AYG63651.1 curlin [Rhizobium jaguaris]